VSKSTTRPDAIQQLREVAKLAKGNSEAFICRAHSVVLAALRGRFPEIATKPASDGLESLREKLPRMLWHDLNRLRILRNQIDHENAQPGPGDTTITLGTLDNLIYFLNVGEEVPDGSRRDWKAFQLTAKIFFEAEFQTQFEVEVELAFSDGRLHKCDLVSKDQDVVIECKSYTWTKTGNEPSAKLMHARNDAEGLRSLKANRKIIVFEDDLRPRDGNSLAELFWRRNSKFISGVEVWRYLNGRFENLS